MKVELATQKVRVTDLVRHTELNRDLYGNKCDGCLVSSPRHRLKNILGVTQAHCKTNIKELSQFADKVEDKLSLLKLTVKGIL